MSSILLRVQSSQQQADRRVFEWELLFFQDFFIMIAMNSKPDSPLAHPTDQKQVLQDIQYSLCRSYIQYASEKLALREAQLIAQTALLLQRMENNSEQKELTQLCTTEASIYNSCREEEQSSFKSGERKGTLKRKSKYTGDRQTRGTMMEALQEIKEVCSERTIALTEQVFNDYHKLSQQQHRNDFRSELLSREHNFKKNRLTCELTEDKIQALQKKLAQQQEQVALLDADRNKLTNKCTDLENQLLKEKEGSSQLKSSLSSSISVYSEFLGDKERNIETRYKQLKFVENQINSHLQVVSELEGCKKCQIIHAIKAQIVEYRKYYEREFQLLSKLFIKYKRMIK